MMIFYSILLAAWPVLNFYNENFLKINDLHDLLFIFSGFLLSYILAFTVLSRIFKCKSERLLLMALIFGAVFFGYSQICSFCGQYNIPFIKSSYIWLLFLLSLLYLGWKLAQRKEFQQATRICLVVMVGLSALLFLKNHVLPHNVQVSDNTEQGLQFSFKHKPNVYFILTDAYARHDTLKEVAGFDNTAFLAELEKRGFSIGKNAYSNYHFTVASLSATMDMKLHDFDEKNLIKYEPQMREALKGKNLVRRIFKNNGYKIINLPAQWHEMACYGYEDVCMKEKNPEIYKSFFSTTPLNIFQKYVPNRYVSGEEVKKAVDIFPNEPKFVFAHYAHVHDAIYDESGKFKSSFHAVFSKLEDAKRYRDSVKQLNNELLALVDFLVKRDSTAIIVIQADHGPTYTGHQKIKDPNYWSGHSDDLRLVETKEDFQYTFGILSAVYVPNLNANYGEVKKYFANSPTPVNLFRTLFSYLSNIENPKLERDSSYFLYFDKEASTYRSMDVNYLKR